MTNFDILEKRRKEEEELRRYQEKIEKLEAEVREFSEQRKLLNVIHIIKLNLLLPII